MLQPYQKQIAQIIKYKPRLELALEKACRQLTLYYDHGLFDEKMYFSVIEAIDNQITKGKKPC